jgi:rhamnosyl/mannosyltransferase
LKTEVEKLNLTDRVKFLGQVPSTVPYYHAADAFWFPSNARSEAFGLVQVEAMASGCPIINTSIPNSGVAWVSQNDLTGLTVPVDDPDALAQAADQIASEPLTRERFAINARRRAIEQFDIRVMARRNAQVYDVVLGRSSAEPSTELDRLEKVLPSSYVTVSG